MTKTAPDLTACIIVNLDHYRDAAVLLRVFGFAARAHAAKGERRCKAAGDTLGAARWQAITAAVDHLGRRGLGQWPPVRRRNV